MKDITYADLQEASGNLLTICQNIPQSAINSGKEGKIELVSEKNNIEIRYNNKKIDLHFFRKDYDNPIIGVLGIPIKENLPISQINLYYPEIINGYESNNIPGHYANQRKLFFNASLNDIIEELKKFEN